MSDEHVFECFHPRPRGAALRRGAGASGRAPGWVCVWVGVWVGVRPGVDVGGRAPGWAEQTESRARVLS